jgi:predicted O-methyltransferase YrrM
MLKCKTAALQDPGELVEFARVIVQENVRSYLEIGSKFGGSLWHVACAMLPKSRLVSVDLAGDVSLKECVKKLKALGHDAHLLVGDSVDPKVIDAARVLGPYDLCLIDGNHTEPFVRTDWINYGAMARIVAFHDIAWDTGGRDRRNRLSIDVPKVWNEIKGGYRHREIKLCKTGQDNGFGILWR